MHTDYNKYGNHISHQVDNIEIGDLVEYLDARTESIGKQKKTIRVPLLGIWDGEKVQFNDKEQTLVRAIPWLKLKAKAADLAELNKVISEFENSHGIKYTVTL
jgi:glutathionylspermidine synthase